MKSSSVQSPPCDSPEAANDALSGLLVTAGQNQTIKVVSTDVQEISPGMFVATATFNVEDLDEDETDEDDERPSDEDKDEKLGVEIDQTSQMALLHGHVLGQTQESSPAHAIPEGQDIPVHPDEYRTEVIDASSRDDAPVPLPEDEGIIETPEDLKKEFTIAEEASGTAVAAVAAIAAPAAADGLTFEERREIQEREEELEEEAELARLRAEAVPLPVDQPVLTPPSEA